jgi:ATP/maltotriose-dependent transcriptional regulator MalT
VAGQIERAIELGRGFDDHAAPERRAAVRLRLARAAVAAGRWADGIREIDRVRDLLGDDAGPEKTAPVDAVAAQLAFAHPSLDRVKAAETLASRALPAAEDVPLPEVACEALEVLGNCARLRDLEEADQLYERALAMAERHGLTVWRIRMMYQLGADVSIRTADITRLVRAREVALQAGAFVTAIELDCELAVAHICRGEYDIAKERAQRSEEDARRLRLTEPQLIALGLRICAAAHSGDRAAVRELGVTYQKLGGLEIDFAAAVSGFGLAIGSLLSEDRDKALKQLAWAVRLEQNQLTHYLSFTRGPHLLLAALAGQADWTQYEVWEHTARGQAAWNWQFVLLAKAVLCGRTGREREAVAAVEEFHRGSAPYPLARHLGLRLIGQAALADGWGDPVPWLRKAEEYFHAASTPAVASACRTLLRGAGAQVPRRRQGGDGVPGALRQLGVTAREFEVLVLVVDRLGNREIGERLFLSPRTVEKHVASLLAKTGTADRVALIRQVQSTSGDAAGRLPMTAP